MQAKLSNAPVAIICINIMKIEDIHSRKWMYLTTEAKRPWND